jgi:hypothetical protein
VLGRAPTEDLYQIKVLLTVLISTLSQRGYYPVPSISDTLGDGLIRAAAKT